MKLGVKRLSGIAVASVGLFLVVRYLPPEMWMSFLGLGLIAAGWALFRD